MKKYFVLIILLINAWRLSAQTNDWHLWVTAGVIEKIPKNWEVGVVIQYRLKNDVRTTDQIRGLVNVNYKLNKFQELGTGYQLIVDNMKGDFAYRNRFILQATASYTLACFTACWRPRLQATVLTNSELKDTIGVDNHNWAVRNRFELKYNIPRVSLTPYVNFELFNFIFTDSTSYYRNRLGVGMLYNLGERHGFYLEYRLDSHIVTSPKRRTNILNIGYTFSF